MNVSVVIPSFNEAASIRACISSLREQSAPPMEIIVVDANSRDGTAGIARGLGARVLVEKKRRGVGRARNFGAGKARGEVIAFTDADSIPEKFWVEKISRHFEREKIACLGGSLQPFGGSLPDSLLYSVFSKWFPFLSSFLGFHAFHGSNMAVEKKAFSRAGGFDVELRALEDNELANRLKRFGKVVFDPSLSVKTSERRFKRFGYARELLNYWAAGFRLYVLRKKTKEYVLVR